MVTNVSELIQSHRSTRRFTRESISEEILDDIFASVQWAPSHCNFQSYSIIVVKDKESKKKLCEICAGQKYVENCPVFLVFCVDFYRFKLASEMYITDFETDQVEHLMVGCVDASLAAQNALITARSHGLGGVMIGEIRNKPDEVVKLLNLPSHTIPIFGMCLGYPAEEQWQKPRLPKKAVIHEESYRTSAEIITELETYEVASADYYLRRTQGKRTHGWTKQMAKIFCNPPRMPHMKEFLSDQGFGQKLTSQKQHILD